VDGVNGFLDDVIGPERKIQGECLCFFFSEKLGENPLFRALD